MFVIGVQVPGPGDIDNIAVLTAKHLQLQMPPVNAPLLATRLIQELHLPGITLRLSLNEIWGTATFGRPSVPEFVPLPLNSFLCP